MNTRPHPYIFWLKVELAFFILNLKLGKTLRAFCCLKKHVGQLTKRTFFPWLYHLSAYIWNKIPHMRSRFILWLLLIVTGGLQAQSVRMPTQKVGIIYNRETAFNFMITTNKGYVAGVDFGRLRTYNKTKFFKLYLGEIKHPKEVRQSADPTVSRSFRPYIFGKKNNLLAFRAAWGIKRYFSEKAKQKGVAMGMSYSFGPTLGLLKPYYLALRYAVDVPAGQNRAIHQKYSPENASIFLNNSRILGASPFTRGFNQLSIVPGGNATIAMHMDWGAFDEFVKALEIGLTADMFATKAPILVSETNNQRLFFNFFLNLQLGKRR